MRLSAGNMANTGSLESEIPIIQGFLFDTRTGKIIFGMTEADNSLKHNDVLYTLC